MSKRKGLSADEKRTRMLEIFHETKDVFQLKDLEKLAPRAKAIIVQSVKEIVQELVDSGLIDSEKIGTSTYFWSFPSKARRNLKHKIEDLETKNNEADKKLKTLTQWVEHERVKKQDAEACTKLAKNIIELKSRKDELNVELEKYKENDPEQFKIKIQKTKELLEAANRWTDNIFYTKTWCKRKFGVEDKDLDKNFEIPEDFDYLETNI